MEAFNIFSNLTSLVVAGISLIISIIALRMTKRVMLLTSREYVPRLDVIIDEKDELTIFNKDNDLFRIIRVGYLKVDMFGFDDSQNREAIRIPLLTKSLMRGDFEDNKEILINERTASACAYLCALAPEEVRKIELRVINCNKEILCGIRYPHFVQSFIMLKSSSRQHEALREIIRR